MTEETKQQEPGVLVGVRNWLSTQGYPLEMRVAAQFQRGGDLAGELVVTQSEFHVVALDEKAREVDVRARFISAHDVAGPDTSSLGTPTTGVFKHVVDIGVICECKSQPGSNKKAWVVFTAPSDSNMAPMWSLLRLGNHAGQNMLVTAHQANKVTKAGFLQLPQQIGYSLLVANEKESRDQGYAVMTKLTSVAQAVARIEYPAPMPASCLVFPLLVVDSPIVECWLDDKGDIQLKEVDRSMVRWKNPDNSPLDVFVDIVHESALPTYVAQFAEAATILRDHESERVRAGSL